MPGPRSPAHVNHPLDGVEMTLQSASSFRTSRLATLTASAASSMRPVRRSVTLSPTDARRRSASNTADGSGYMAGPVEQAVAPIQAISADMRRGCAGRCVWVTSSSNRTRCYTRVALDTASLARLNPLGDHRP